MKKNILFLLILTFLILFFHQANAQVYEFQVTLKEQDRLDFLPVSPLVSILPDKGNFASYFIGDSISLDYEAMKTGYVSILDYTSDGKGRIIKNNEPVALGIKRRIQAVVTEPEGMERFLIVLSPRIIPDRILVEGMSNPSRISAIIGESAFLNRSIIQVIAKRQEASSVMRFHPVPDSLTSGRNLKIRLVLTDKMNNTLVNRRVQWQVNQGTLDTYQTYTNTAGESGVWYLAPRVLEMTPVDIRAFFDGDTNYGRSENMIRLTIEPELASPVLMLSPKDFQIVGEQSLNFIAKLTDKNGKPLTRQKLFWTSSFGRWEKRSTITGDDGVSINRWISSPSVVKTPVDLQVKYEGMPGFMATEDVSTGSVVGLEVISGKGIYFVDCSNGKPDSNFDESIYRGEIASGFTVNPVSALIMKSGEYLDVKFQFPSTWETGACYLWGKSKGNTQVLIWFNDHKIFTGSIAEGMVTPLDFHSFHLSQFLMPGENRLKIEVKAPDDNGVFALQRFLVVF